ncbi:MAG: DMT family transporter [Rhizobiaceae bacterium]
MDTILKGVLSLCAGVFVFTAQDTILKAVSGGYPLTEAMALRAIVAGPILAFLIWRSEGFAALGRNAGFLFARAVVLFFAYFAYYLAFPALPLADAVALYFTVPLFVVALAGPYLGEKANAKIWGAVAIGLIGVAVMLKPRTGLFEPAALLSLFSAAAYASGQLMARKKGSTTSAAVFAFWQNGFFLAVALILPLVFASLDITTAPHPSLQFLVRPWVWPTQNDALLMLSCGVIAAAGTIFLVNGYRWAPANTAAAFEYTGLIWVSLFAFMFFGEVPGASTLTGALFIVAAGLLALRAQSTHRLDAGETSARTPLA